MAERSVTLSTDIQKREREKVSHKGIDCVSIRLNGEHYMYSCYHCLERITCDIEDANSMDNQVSLWKPPVWALDKSVVCEYSQMPKGVPNRK